MAMVLDDDEEAPANYLEPYRSALGGGSEVSPARVTVTWHIEKLH
jgi:hypothetical protein